MNANRYSSMGMKASEIIQALKELMDKHGDLPVRHCSHEGFYSSVHCVSDKHAEDQKEIHII